MPTYSFNAYTIDAFSYDSATGELTLASTYSHKDDRVRIDIDDQSTGRYLDGDGDFDEVGDDDTQDAVVTDMYGNPVASGQVYAEKVDVFEAPDGSRIEITRVEIAGQVVGYMTTAPLDPDTTYQFLGSYNVTRAQADDPETEDFDESRADTRQEYSEFQSVPCFGPTASIATPVGEVPIAWLRPGHEVLTRDGGSLPVRWVGRFAAGGAPAVTFDAPRGPLVLSRSHRVLLDAPTCPLLFGEPEVLAAARHLMDAGRARSGRLDRWMCFFHILLDRHAVIRANGLWVESLFLGDRAADPDGMTVPEALRLELARGHRRTARPVIGGQEVAALLGPVGRTDRRRKKRVARESRAA
ncbi:Hint domain-containing protein [Jannaschia aquimarina]|uniref:Hint domain-containing protein n=1 Tax=Jannaschia aquimarina TaxID=935700 RepID=UPI0005C74DF7|nr:Hint domain-containing protein [Jannaschia aquimarina]SNS63416.1 Hint domain-containing protein [Jannaschia aquimarina]